LVRCNIKEMLPSSKTYNGTKLINFIARINIYLMHTSFYILYTRILTEWRFLSSHYRFFIEASWISQLQIVFRPARAIMITIASFRGTTFFLPLPLQLQTTRGYSLVLGLDSVDIIVIFDGGTIAFIYR